MKNTEANVVKLKVMEQVPLSSDERLKVQLWYILFAQWIDGDSWTLLTNNILKQLHEQSHSDINMISFFCQQVVLLQPDLRKQHVSIPFSHGHALLNDDNNIEWHCTVPSDTNIELQLVYTVEFPPNDIVEGLPST